MKWNGKTSTTNSSATIPKLAALDIIADDVSGQCGLQYHCATDCDLQGSPYTGNRTLVRTRDLIHEGHSSIRVTRSSPSDELDDFSRVVVVFPVRPPVRLPITPPPLPPPRWMPLRDGSTLDINDVNMHFSLQMPSY
jgi:hypothetical protein